MEEENKEVETTKTEQETTNTDTKETKEKENKQNEEQIKAAGKSAFLESLGYDEETLENILKAHKEAEDANKTDLQKTKDALDKTTQELTKERGLRILAEAKTEALVAGAKPELIEDLVVIAKSRVTKDKDITTVINEIKSSNVGNVYFKTEESEEEETNKTKNKGTVTRGRVMKKESENKNEVETKNKEGKYDGTIAGRLFSGKKKPVKSSYFEN